MSKSLNLLDRSIPTWKLVIMLAWPSIIEQLLHTAVNYVDTAMVGSIGTYATAAIGVCTSTIFLLMGVMNATGLGFSVMVARKIGEGNHEEARTILRQSMLAVVVVGLSLTLLVELILAPNLPRWMGAEPDVLPHAITYFRVIGANYLLNTGMIMATNMLRCMGDTKTPLKFNILTNLVNVVCNRLLNNPIDVRESRVAEPKRDAKPFNLSDYDILRFNPREKDTQRKHYPYFKERGINMGTQFAFQKHFFLVTKHRVITYNLT